MRRAIAIVLCFAGMLGFYFGYRSIFTGEAFGVPFGSGFTAAASVMIPATPLIFDRDDPTIIRGVGVTGAIFLIIIASGFLGAGMISNNFDPMYFLGSAIGACAGTHLSYVGYGIDRRERGVPRGYRADLL